MQTTFRAKLSAVVATIAAAFVVLISASTVASRSVQRHLDRIQTYYLPRMELGPSLQRQLSELTRAFQDSVAAHDLDGLTRARGMEAAFLKHLDESRAIVDPEQSAALASALQEYVDSADQVSRRLIAGETGEDLVDAMGAMQSRQRTVADRLDKATHLEEGELGRVFATATATQRQGGRVRLLVSVVCMVAVVLLSAWLGRGVLRSVSELRVGFERFGRGDLATPIPVAADEFGAVAQEANRMAEALRRTLADLEAFNYSVSHDLRAPLRPLDGFSQALLEDYGDRLDGTAKDYLHRIRAAAKRMSELIDDLLGLSRLGRGDLDVRTCDLATIAREIVDELRRGDPARKVDLVTSPAEARGDARLLRIALENLLGNAWKFSRSNPAARIEIGSRREGAETVFFVRDNGAGFDPAYSGKLFQPFQRLHPAKEFEGTGIGLAIVQRIVRRHGGRVWAESSPGNGATFHFTLQEAR